MKVAKEGDLLTQLELGPRPSFHLCLFSPPLSFQGEFFHTRDKEEGDRAKAVSFFQMAADQDNAEALAKLGTLLFLFSFLLTHPQPSSIEMVLE